jgi:pimeloyl-ACP methyl ester carboxylesterase
MTRSLFCVFNLVQPTLLVWGEQDLVFPMELAHRLNRFVDAIFEIIMISKFTLLVLL